MLLIVGARYSCLRPWAAAFAVFSFGLGIASKAGIGRMLSIPACSLQLERPNSAALDITLTTSVVTTPPMGSMRLR